MVTRSDFIEACAKGGAALKRAMTELVQLHGGRLMRDAGLVGAHEDSAADLVQQSLVKAWQRCGEFRGQAEVLSWVRAILRHAVIDQLRARRPEQPLLNADDEVFAEVDAALLAAAQDQGGDPLGLAERAEAQRLYDSCFARFAADHPQAAAVIRWIAEDDLGIEEIAVILGRSQGATREFVSQCRKKARLYLAPWYALVRPDERLAA